MTRGRANPVRGSKKLPNNNNRNKLLEGDRTNTPATKQYDRGGCNSAPCSVGDDNQSTLGWAGSQDR